MESKTAVFRFRVVNLMTLRYDSFSNGNTFHVWRCITSCFRSLSQAETRIEVCSNGNNSNLYDSYFKTLRKNRLNGNLLHYARLVISDEL